MNGEPASNENQSSPSTRAIEVKRRYQSKLMAMANVVGVGVGIRKVSGEPTGDVAVVVMVTHKVPRDLLDPADRVPRELDGVPVDVQAVGKIEAYSG